MYNLIINIGSFGIMFVIYLVSVLLLLVLVVFICQYLYVSDSMLQKLFYIPISFWEGELTLVFSIQEKENKTPALALRRSTRKRKAGDNA